MGTIFVNESFRLTDSGQNVDVLALGDSWFHYPFNNLIPGLHGALEQPTIYVLGDTGKRADELADGAWLAKFRQMLSDYPSIRLACISAGGNDFAGLGDLDDKILKPDCTNETTAAGCFRAGQPDGVFADVLAAYRRLLDAASAAHPGLPVLVHNYDYAIPDGRTLPGMRSWLKLPMDNCRVPTAGAPRAGIRREIVATLIDRFTLALDALETEYTGGTNARAELVWSAGTLRADEWANELHPRPAAFNRLVRDAWRTPARRAFGLPV
ncbi:MAG: hypothetical protein ABIX11_07605 [Casimicrobiaceae bacterium]